MLSSFWLWIYPCDVGTWSLLAMENIITTDSAKEQSMMLCLLPSFSSPGLWDGMPLRMQVGQSWFSQSFYFFDQVKFCIVTDLVHRGRYVGKCHSPCRNSSCGRDATLLPSCDHFLHAAIVWRRNPKHPRLGMPTGMLLKGRMLLCRSCVLKFLTWRNTAHDMNANLWSGMV